MCVCVCVVCGCVYVCVWVGVCGVCVCVCGVCVRVRALNVAFLLTAFDILSVSSSVLYVIMFDYKAIHVLLIYCVQMLNIACQNLKRIVIL